MCKKPVAKNGKRGNVEKLKNSIESEIGGVKAVKK